MEDPVPVDKSLRRQKLRRDHKKGAKKEKERDLRHVKESRVTEKEQRNARTPFKQRKPRQLRRRTPKGKSQLLRSRSFLSQSSLGTDECEPDPIEPANEAYPPQPAPTLESVFSDKLSLLSPQRQVPKRVNREVVIDTIFNALFADKKNRKPVEQRAWDESETDNEPDEDWIRKGLDAALFDGLSSDAVCAVGSGKASDFIYRFIDAKLVYKLVNGLRFDDERTQSVRAPILRALYNKCPHLRETIVVALSCAAAEFVDAVRLRYFRALRSEFSDFNGTGVQSEKKERDHGHGMTELLRFLIENSCESVRSFDLDAKEPEDEDREPRTVIVGRALVALCKSHLGSWAGTDVDELVDCAGQYVMYNPQMAQFLLGQLLSSWPIHSSEQQVLYLRVVVRVLMASVDGSLSRTQMALRVFERLVKLLLDGQVQVAREVLTVLNSQFIRDYYILPCREVLQTVKSGLHKCSMGHWNSVLKELAEEQFDILLDFS